MALTIIWKPVNVVKKLPDNSAFFLLFILNILIGTSNIGVK